MYVFELAVKFRCSECDVVMTAPEQAGHLVCPDCGTFQAAHRSRMEHFECWGGETGRRTAEAEIPLRMAERGKLRRLRRRRWPVALVCEVTGVRFGRIKAIYEQMQAVEHRLKRCQDVLDS